MPTDSKGIVAAAFVSTAAFWIVLLVLSLYGVPLPAPSASLEAWTKFIATVVGVAVAARALSSGAASLEKLANRQ